MSTECDYFAGSKDGFVRCRNTTDLVHKGKVPETLCQKCRFRTVDGVRVMTPERPSLPDRPSGQSAPILPDHSTRGKCSHLRSKRSCCDTLYVCREFGSCSLMPVRDDIPCCESCERWVPEKAWAPNAGKFADRPWEGPYRRKPWGYAVTVAIPVVNAAEACAVIVDLLRLQTEPPFILLIDTGSDAEQFDQLQQLRAEDCEVHSLRINGVQHPSDFPAMAMDVAFTLCRTPYLLATHADVFLTGRGVVAELLQLCRDGNPVVGYEITERPHSDWPGMVGHTLTMFDIVAMDRINAGWSMRRLLANYAHPDGYSTDRGISPATAPNWPDTELLINYQCRAAGLTPLIIGREKNAARTQDHRIDHCRSWASAQLYASGGRYAESVSGWLEDGIEKAKARISDWTNSPKPSTHI
ncbi:MAG: glycosyltransferase family 2 protein [Planctomycetaceae bacterium]|nr:glycosyltransferase family 2 protein [Planctomycetaceae bacterium]